MFPHKVHTSYTAFPGFLYAVPVRDTDARCSKYLEKKAGKTPIPFHLWYLSFACMSLSVFDVMHLRPKLADCTAAFSDCMGITPIRNGLR